MARSEDVKLNLTRAGYVMDMFKARASEEGGREKYGVQLMIAKTDTATLKTLERIIIGACVAAGWGDEAKVRDLLAKGIIKNPVLDGDGKQGMTQDGTPKEGLAGTFFVRASSGADYPPQVVDENVQRIATYDPARFKSGDYGYPVVNAYTWDHPKNGKGVTIGILAFQKIKDGDPLGGSGGVDASKFFKPETVQGEAPPAETQGGAGAGGLFG